ncbi:MAG: ATP-binding protein [Candidatus Binatus sp.]
MRGNKPAKRNFTDRLLWTGFAAAIVAAVAIARTADKDANEANAWSKWITHAQNVLGVLDDTRGNTLSALAAIQNYYQSSDLKNLDRVINLVSKLNRQSVVLRSLTLDNASQQNRLDQFDRNARRMTALAENIVSSAPAFSQQQSIKTPQAAELSAAVDQLLEQLHQMNAAEGRLLTERTARARARSRQSITVLGVGGSIVIGWLLIVGGYALLTTRRLIDTAKALALSHEKLARVTDRKRVEDDLRALNESERRHAAQLEVVNKELEAFSYSVSHDLRAPLRSIDGFSSALMEDYADKLDEQANTHLRRIRAATGRMAQLIDDLLKLALVTRSEMHTEAVDLSALANDILAECRKGEPLREVECVVQEHVVGHGDPHLLRSVLENLLGNAWKFTSKKQQAKIEFAMADQDGQPVYFVRDNGAGFDMTYAEKLFGAFQRLHAAADFPGTGVGLATVQRIIRRHGGRVSAQGAEGRGATFSFTLEVNHGGQQ